MAILISPFTPALAIEGSTEEGFDEYGMNVNSSVDSSQARGEHGISKQANTWQTLSSSHKVPLDKVWTIKFSSQVFKEAIDGITISQEGHFIPVEIIITGDEARVKPRDEFKGNTSYELRIFLNNGKRYRKAFHTVDEYRKGDTLPANSWQESNKLFIDETVVGNIGASDDRDDWYEIHVPEHGRLKLEALQLEDRDMELYLYGNQGSNQGSITSDTSGARSLRRINQGLAPGVYHVRVRSSNQGDYQLTTSFEADPAEGGLSGSNFIDAMPIAANSSHHGWIGYYSEDSSQRVEQWFKLELTEPGELALEVQHLLNQNVEMYLYGIDGNNSNSINSSTAGSRSVRQLTTGLRPGTYYVRLRGSNYGDISFTSKFKPEALSGSGEIFNYQLAADISPNAKVTGQIGHYYENRAQNTEDWYRIKLDRAGTLNIFAEHDANKNIEITLYGEHGPNQNGITWDSAGSKSVRTISRELSPGTYTIRVRGGEHGGYTLETAFN